MVWKVIAAVAVCAGLYLLWVNGYMVTQVKRAITYVESGKGKRASFTSCTGFTRRRVNFRESGFYHFVLSPELSKGEVSAELSDSNKKPLLRLNADTPSADVELDCKRRYNLTFRFESASGKYTLSWEHR